MPEAAMKHGPKAAIPSYWNLLWLVPAVGLLFLLRFRSPAWLYLLFLIPGVLFFYRWGGLQKARALTRFVSGELLESMTATVDYAARKRRTVLVIISLILLVIALGRPLYSNLEEEITRRGIDIIIALDTSTSMLAEDMAPNRLSKAKHEIGNLIDRLQGDRIGLVVFAGDAYVACPLTLDYAAARAFLDDIDTRYVSLPGTNIESAIRRATEGFVEGERKYKVLLLITDGEHLEEGADPIAAAQEAAEEGVKIYSIGVGDPEGGVPIPIRDRNGNLVEYKKDRSGNPVSTRLDDTTLRRVALATNGKYFQATSAEFELDSIYDDIRDEEKKELQSRLYTRGADRFQYPLAAALILFLAAELTSDRRRGAATHPAGLIRTISEGEEAQS
jgi:Ca-activated chloride channel family protein